MLLKTWTDEDVKILFRVYYKKESMAWKVIMSDIKDSQIMNDLTRCRSRTPLAKQVELRIKNSSK